jgi:hypothetical protein
MRQWVWQICHVAISLYFIQRNLLREILNSDSESRLLRVEAHYVRMTASE